MTFAVLGFVALSSFSSAYAGPPERAGDRQEIREDRREVAGDVVDATRLRGCIADWHQARLSRANPAERAADACLESWLRREIAENRAEVADDRADLRESRVEAIGVGPDDQRDKAGDKVDLARERADRARTRQIALALQDLHPQFMNNTATPADYDRKAELLRELDGLAQREIARTQGERVEDRRELREDRHR